MRRISKELIGASSVPIILSILKQGDSYGYAIMQSVDKLSGGNISWKEGSLYPVLKKMEANGLISSYWEIGEQDRPRKYYRLNKSGKEQLQKEIKEWTTVQELFNKLWGRQADLI